MQNTCKVFYSELSVPLRGEVTAFQVPRYVDKFCCPEALVVFSVHVSTTLCFLTDAKEFQELSLLIAAEGT